MTQLVRMQYKSVFSSGKITYRGTTSTKWKINNLQKLEVASCTRRYKTISVFTALTTADELTFNTTRSYCARQENCLRSLKVAIKKQCIHSRLPRIVTRAGKLQPRYQIISGLLFLFDPYHQKA